MTRALVNGVTALCLALAACTHDAPPREVEQPKPVVTMGAVAAEPIATATASASVGEDAPPPRVRVDMSAALARLPKDAAMYGFFRPTAGDTLVEWAKNPEGARREFRRLVPSGTFLELVKTLGVDPAVPVAFAVVGPDLAASQKMIDGVIAAAKPSGVKGDPIDAAIRRAAPNGLLVRFVFPTLSDEKAILAELERVSEKARMRFVACPKAEACTMFMGQAPFGVIDRGSTTIAFYKQAGTVEVDWLEARLGDSESRVKAIDARRKAVGGPSGVCSKLDSEADLSVCVDATHAGETGAALGLFSTVSAVQHGAVDPAMRGKILQQGKKEALQNITIANPKRKLLDDGTISISIAKTGYTAAASWLLTEASTSSVEAALARETCASPKTVVADLVPVLKKAFGDVGSDFKDLKQRQEDFREAGSGAVLVAFARIWPNMLGIVTREPDLAGFTFDRLCARANADRLELRMDGPRIDVDRL